MPIRPPAAAAQAVCAAAGHHRLASTRFLRRRHCRSALRRDRPRRGSREPGRRRRRFGFVAVRVRSSRGRAALSTTVIVSVPHGGAAGNILRTGILSRVLEADRSLKVVLASPLVSDPGFVREFTHPRITLEGLPPHRPEGLEARLLALMQAGYLESGVTESVKIRRAEATAKGIVRWLPLKKALAALVAPSMLRPATRYDVSDRRVAHPAAQQLFDRHQPSLLVVSNPGLIFSEVPLLRTARQRGVRTIAIDPSWDNFTNKLIPVRRVDRLIVWNDLMKAQAIALHGYSESQIRVAGT